MEKTHPLKIGLEIHGYLDTKEKLFCKCLTPSKTKKDKPNTNICPICTGQPGSKPMLINKSALEKLIQIALVLKCKVNHDKQLIWNRKHYSWPDNPKGYQNTISGSHTLFPAEKGKFHGIKITECHLEEDPAQWNPETGKIDYNRSGLPLIEIVTDPDFTSADQVTEWLKKLIHSLSYIKALRKNAGIKVDVNISTHGDRVEIKNLNSIQNIEHALEYEIARQLENHKQGIKQEQETHTYDATQGKTILMRTKENAQDYRFIPDPDLPVIRLTEKQVRQIKSKLPEMPEEKLDKLVKKYKLDKKQATILTKNLELVEFVEELGKQKINIKDNISWLTIELLRVLNYNKKTLDDGDVSIQPEHLAELIKAVEKKQITPLKAKQIMNDFIPESFSISENKEELTKIADNAIENLAKQAIIENPKAVQDYKSGQENALNFLVGQVMKLSNRRADFQTAKDYLLRELK